MHGHVVGLIELAFLFLIVLGVPGAIVMGTLRPIVHGPTKDEVEDAVTARIEPALGEMYAAGYEQARKELRLCNEHYQEELREADIGWLK